MSNFDPYATGYSALNALWSGKCARLAYQAQEAVKAIASEWEFVKFRFFDLDATEAYIMAGEDVVVLAFRGTEPSCLRDWMTDAKVHLVPGCGKGLVHSGFLTALNCVWKDMLTTLAEFQTDNQPILVTGHSLGAALATLAVAKLREQGQPVYGLYTFGSPRVGNQAFANWFNADFGSRAFRFVNNNDVVTRVPPRSFGYCHVGRFLYFDTAGKLQDNIQFWNEFLETVKGGMDDFLKPGLSTVKDHDMGLYENNLLLNIDKVLSEVVTLGQ